MKIRFLIRGEQNFFFLVAGMIEHGRIGFGLHTEMQQQRGVAAIVENHVREAAVMPLKDAVGVVPILDQALALDREHRRACISNRGGRMVLGRIDVAGGPTHIGAEMRQRLDQHGRLDGHVQRTGDTGAAQGLLRAVFFPCRHQAGHLGLGDINLVAAPGGERDILDDVVAGLGLRLCRSGHDDS